MVLTVIRRVMWKGLNSLEELDLGYNKIADVSPKGFAKLSQIKRIFLYHNNLTTLKEDVFQAADFPDSGGHPAELYLELFGNPLVNDSSLAWISRGQQQGWLHAELVDGYYYDEEHHCAGDEDYDYD